jgi:hypothetical protein
VSLAVDLPLQDFLGARDSNGRYLATQLFACPVHFLLDFGECCGDLPLALFYAIGLAFRNDFVRPGVSLVENGRRLLACVIDDLIGFRFGFVQALLATFRGGEIRRSHIIY